MKVKIIFFLMIILTSVTLCACDDDVDGNNAEGNKVYTADDFVYGSDEISDVDDEGNYFELFYDEGTAYALIEREDAAVSVCLDVTYIFHEPNTEGYYCMSTQIISSGTGNAKAEFEQADSCVLYVKAVYTFDVSGKETVITKELGELK